MAKRSSETWAKAVGEVTGTIIAGVLAGFIFMTGAVWALVFWGKVFN